MRTRELLSVNEKKWDFTQKSRNLERIPHTQGALKEHIKRACYQANCWDKASIPKPKTPKSGLVNVSGHCNKMAIIVDNTTTRCTITSVVIIYVRHQITSLQYGIKGGAQGTRWRPSFEITRWPQKWQHVSSVSSSVSSRNRLK